MRNAIFHLACLLVLPLTEAADDRSPSTLIRDGDRPAAAKLAYRRLAALIVPDGRYRPGAAREEVRKTAALGLVPDLAVIMRPAADAPFAAQREFVIVMAELEPPASQLPLIAQLAASHPADPDLSALHLVAAPPDRRAPAIDHIARDPQDDFSALATRLEHALTGGDSAQPVEPRAIRESWQIVGALLDATPPAISPNKNTAAFARLLALLVAEPPGFPEPVPFDGDLSATLRAVATTLIDFPASSRDAFATLHALRDQCQLTDADLTALAEHSMRAVLREEDRVCTAESFDSPGASQQFRPFPLSTRWLEPAGRFGGPTPYGWLLDRALRSGIFHQPAEFLACFSQRNRGRLERQLEFFGEPTVARATELLPEPIPDDEVIAADQLILATVICNLCGINPAKGFDTLLAAAEHPHAADDDPAPSFDTSANRILQILALRANTALATGNDAAIADAARLTHEHLTALDRSPDKPADAPDCLADFSSPSRFLSRVHPESGSRLASFLRDRWPELATGPQAEWFFSAISDLTAQVDNLPERLAYQDLGPLAAEALLAPLIRHNPGEAAALWARTLETCAKLPPRPGITPDPPAFAARAAAGLFANHSLGPDPADAVALLRFLIATREHSPPSYPSPTDDAIMRESARLLAAAVPGHLLPRELAPLANSATSGLAALLECFRDHRHDTLLPLVRTFVIHRAEIATICQAAPDLIGVLESRYAAPSSGATRFSEAAQLALRADRASPPEAEYSSFLRDNAIPAGQRLRLAGDVTRAIAPRSATGETIPAALVALLSDPGIAEARFRDDKLELLIHLGSRADLSDLSAQLAATCCTVILPDLHRAALATEGLPRERWRDEFFPTWLSLALRSGKRELIQQPVAASPGSFRGDSAVIARLAVAGLHPIAATLVPTPDAPFRAPASGHETFFTATLEQALPLVLAEIPDSAVRYRVATHLSDLSDSTGADPPAVPRLHRLRALASRFAAEAPAQPVARAQLLAIVGPGPRGENLAEIRRLTAGLRYAGSPVQDAMTPELRAASERLLRHSINADLRAGHPESWLEHIGLVLATEDAPSNAYGTYRVLSLLHAHWGAYLAGMLHLPAESRAAAARRAVSLAAEVSRRYATSTAPRLPETCATYGMLAQLVGSLAGEYEAAWRDLPASASRPSDADPVWLHALALAETADGFLHPAGTDDLPRFLATVLADPTVSRVMAPDARSFPYWHRAGLATPAGLAEIVRSLPDTCPRKAEYLGFLPR